MLKKLETFIGSSIGEAKSLGWFGLAADPPTLAHREVVQAALESGRVDRVIVFPASKLNYKNFHASDEQRMDMMRLWMKASYFDDRVIISWFDIERTSAFLWFDLWKKTQKLAPDIKHYFILGSREYQEIPVNWEKGNELLGQANFLIIPREGYDPKQVFPGDQLLDISPLKGSSTAVREGNIGFVDELVKDYILEHGLYSM